MADDMETLTHLRAKILGVFGDYWCDHCEERMPDGLLTEGDLRAAFGAHLSAVLAARHDADIAAAKAAGAAEVIARVEAVLRPIERDANHHLSRGPNGEPSISVVNTATIRAALTTGGEG